MSSGRPDSWFRTLRFRLTFWNSVALLLLVLATLLGLREGLRFTLQREMDALLAEDVEEVRLLLARHFPDRAQIREQLDRKAVSHKARLWYVRIFDAGGAIVVESIGAPAPYPPIEPRPTGPFDRDGYRMLQETFHRDGLPLLEVRVGCSRDFVDDDVLTLTKILLVAGLALLVLCPLLGFWLAARTIRPLAIIVDTAAHLQPGNLAARLPLAGTGDELDRLAATLNGLLDRLAKHLDRQRAFVANAAHELRSPLAALRTSAEVALSVNRTSEEYRELLAEIVEGCEGLGALVTQLLLLAEGEAGLVGPAESIRLDQLTQKAVDMFAGIAEQRGVTLRFVFRGIAFVAGNATHVRQVVNNLIDNAIKFTPAGGLVEVEVQGGSGPRASVLRVRDTGRGIAPENLPHIFERFYRGDRARHRDPRGGGTGLGLSICQALVVAHGGTIEVDSAPGKGTTVTVRLPAG